jgi:hypothetical protein
MIKLNDNWLTENHIDFEYKKYQLLAYLQEVSKNFDTRKLYPFLRELIDHHRTLLAFRNNQEILKKGFKEELIEIDLEKFALLYESLVHDSWMMEEIMKIVDFSIPKFEQYVKEGSKKFDEIAMSMKFETIGIESLRTEEGYLMLEDNSGSGTRVYEYQISIFERPDASYRGINTEFISEYKRSITTTYEAIKIDVVKTCAKYSNPATFLISTEMTLPLEETFLPVAKRKLLWYIGNKAQT